MTGAFDAVHWQARLTGSFCLRPAKGGSASIRWPSLIFPHTDHFD